MDKLDPSTKKQLGLLLAKTSQKPPKSIVSSVPLAQIRKSLLKDHNISIESSPSGMNINIIELSPEKTIPNSKISPSKSNLSPSKFNTIFKLSPSKSLPLVVQVPMEEILIVQNSPIKNQDQDQDCELGNPMEIDNSTDVFMDAQSKDNLVNDSTCDSVENCSDEEIILNVLNVTKNLQPSTPTIGQKQRLQHSISSPSIPTRIKSLGLAAGTPLRAIYRNASETELNYSKISDNFNINSTERQVYSSLLNDLIEEFCITRDEECLKKIISLTSSRTGDFDGLTSSLIQKLFKSTSELGIELKMKILMNFLRNESFLLSSSGREIIEIIEEDSIINNNNNVIKIICQSNLTIILMENLIEMCCERLSEFKLMLMAEFIKNCVVNVEEMISKCITPLSLVINTLMICTMISNLFRP